MNDLAAYDFWGNCTWVGGDDMARCERLRLYEKYRLAELRYEEEIAKLKRERDAITKDFRMVVHSAINTLGINARLGVSTSLPQGLMLCTVIQSTARPTERLSSWQKSRLMM